MAFGASNDDIQLKVTLDDSGAKQQAEKLKTEIKASFGDIANAAKSPVTAIQDITKALASSNATAAKAVQGISSVGEALAPLTPYAIAAAAAIGGLAFAFKKVIAVAGDGDKFGDIADAFQENADKAGVLSDVLLTKLSRAFGDAASNADLMAQANKAFAVGISPQVFDDLAAAAKRYADATGGDAKQALDELIAGVNSGREGLLKKFGVMQNGVLIIKEFTDAEYQNAQASRSVTNVYEQFAAQLSNVYQELAIAINNSEALKLAVEAVSSATLILVQGLKDLALATISVADMFANAFNKVLNETIASIITLVSLGVDLSSGAWPDLNRAIAEGDKYLAQWSETADKAGTVAVKLGGGAEKASVGINKATESIRDSIDKLSKQTTDQLERAFGFRTFLEFKIEREVAAAFQAYRADTPALVTALDTIQKSILQKMLDPEAAKRAAEAFMKAVEQNLKPIDTPTTLGGEDVKADVLSQSGEMGPLSIGFDKAAFARQLAQSIQAGIALAFEAAIDGFQREDAPRIGSTLGGAIGNLFGPGGQIVGQTLGQAIGEYIAQEGSSRGTQTRKQIDAYFADLFNAERIAVVINGQLTRIKDLTFEGTTLFGDVSFGGENFFTGISTMSQEAQAGITAVGVAFGQLTGIAEEQSRLIGAVFVNNVGTSLENLRALIQSTGKSFEELSNAILEAFYNGMLTIEEFYNGLVKLEELFSVGFPDAVGDVDRALRNFNAALADGRGSRQLINSMRDAAAEAEEVGMSFPDLVGKIGQSLGLTAEQTALLLEYLKREGIDTVEELKDASIAQLVAFLESARRIRDQGASDLSQLPSTPKNPSANSSATSLFKPTNIPSSRTSANRRDTVAEEAKRRREELYRLLTTSTQYANILDALNAKTISQAEASRKISGLYADIDRATRSLADAEKSYREALEKRGKKQSDIAAAAKRVDDAQRRLDELTDKAKKATETQRFDIAGALKLVQSVNELAIVARTAGVNLESLTKTLTEGFIRGRLSLTEYRAELQKLEETFSDGIPGAVGDVQGAIKNLFEGGTAGGLFSVDAFKDIFAEFDELFSRSSSQKRKETLGQLTRDFSSASTALQNAISSGAAPATIAELKKQFEGASKALNDFRDSSDKADFADLRSELSKYLSEEQLVSFFSALENEGIKSFDEIKKAGPDAITRILSNLDSLGFGFGETTDRIKGILGQLDQANIKQTEGKDILGQALDIIKGFNADTLANSFDTLGDKINGTLDLLSRLGGRTFNNDVVLNVRVEGESGAASLVESLFGDGGGSSDSTGGAGPGLSASERREFDRLSNLRKKGRLSKSDRAMFEDLRRKARG